MRKITLLFLLLPFLGLGQVQIGDDIYGENPDDRLGLLIQSIDISSDGSIIALGTRFNDDNGTDSGHVRMLQNVSGNWTQIGDDINGEFSNDQLGFALSLSEDGSTIAIGVPFNDESFSAGGQVKIYENQGGSWVQLGLSINAIQEAEYFGYSISLSSDGSILAVGAENHTNSVNNFKTGRASVFENQNGVWTQIGQNIFGEADSDRFGNIIELSSDGSFLAVGARGSDVNGDNSGQVRVFENQLGVWTQIGQEINGAAATDIFGFDLSLSSDGSILAIGAARSNENGENSGQVRVFENTGTDWTQIGQNINGEVAGDRSGNVSISSDGTILTVGAPYNDDNGIESGHVRIFKNIENTWIQVGQNINGDATLNFSGTSTHISSNGKVIVIGAGYNNGNGSQSGQVRVFTIASELGIIEVVDDIQGNLNDFNITAEQLNDINGVSGAIEGVNYTTALDNGTFVDENNPTTSEIQAIIDQVNDALSLNENDVFNFKIYPNPTKTQFTIQLDPSVQLEKVSIYNTLGQVVLTSEENTINTSKLSSGSYIVDILTNKGKSSKKLIIE